MGPDQDPPPPVKNQDARRTSPTRIRQKKARRPRRPVCLPKGCGQVFQPKQPMARYCSRECREEVRRWREVRRGLSIPGKIGKTAGEVAGMTFVPSIMPWILGTPQHNWMLERERAEMQGKQADTEETQARAGEAGQAEVSGSS